MFEEGKVSFKSRYGDQVFGLISNSRIFLIFSGQIEWAGRVYEK